MPLDKEPRKENILFLDIETVPQYRKFSMVPEPLQRLWEEKLARQKLLKENESVADAYGRAGLYAEFGKVICMVAGFVEKGILELRSFSGDDEKKLLEDFTVFLLKFTEFRQYEIILCAHNGKEFDYPYLARRMIINRLKIPEILDNSGKKPWEVHLLDTLELWKFGDYKAYTSLNLMAYILGLPSPKQEMDGSMVGNVYYEKNDLENIIRYCKNDVITLANVYFRIKGEPTVESKTESLNL